MKTKPPPPSAAPVLREDDIRAYAAHLHVQSGRIPNRDIENWLEAKACLEAHLPPVPAGRRAQPVRQCRGRGFTMPASDASLWIERGEGGSPRNLAGPMVLSAWQRGDAGILERPNSL